MYEFVFLSQSIYVVIDFALYALHSAFEVNSAAVPYIRMLQACCGSAGCVYTHLGIWRQSTGQMFVWGVHSRVRLPSTPTPSSSPGASDPSNQAEKSRWVHVCVCLRRKWDQTSNLPHCVREHPPPQPTEESVSHQAPNRASKTASVCLCECACAYIENREKKKQQVWVYVLSFSVKIKYLPSPDSVWYDFLSVTIQPLQPFIAPAKSTHQFPLLGVPLPAATISSCRWHFQEACRLGRWCHGPWCLHHNSTGQVHLQRHLHLPGQESARCPWHSWRDSTPCGHHRSAVWFSDKILLNTKYSWLYFVFSPVNLSH